MAFDYSYLNSSKITNFYLEASRGRVDGVFTVHKFGYAPEIDTADGFVNIWDGVVSTIPTGKISTYTYSSTADIQDIASSDNSDTQSIYVEGLDTNWNRTTQYITLTGQTVVQLTTPLVRVYRMVNRGAVDVAGTIYLTTVGAARTAGVPTVTNTVRAIIKDGDNQTQMAIMSVPAGYTMFISHAWGHISNRIAASAQIRIRTRDFGGVFRTVHTLALNSTGSGGDHRPYEIPIAFSEKSDLMYLADSSANDVGVSSGFHAVLIKN